MKSAALTILKVALGFLALSIGIPQPANAQPQSGASSTLYDPSIRAAGMGRAGVAVFWGEDPNDWVNPSLLAYRRGIRYERGKTQLLVPLSDDVHFKSNRVTFAGWGIGISMGGGPVQDVGGSRLDYGKSVATDIDGNEIGEFTSFERIESFAIGLSAAQLLESAARILGKDPPAISRFADVSLGHAWKSVLVFLFPGELVLDGDGRGEAKQRDHGLLVRVTPYNSIDFPGWLPGVERVARVRIDASYGTAAVNYDDDAEISVIDEDNSDPIAKDSHWGWAVHGDLALPSGAEESLRAGRFGWITEVIAPLLSFGLTRERSQYAVRDVPSGEEIDLSGWELTLANIFTLRRGPVDDPTGTIIGDTSGWSLGLRWGKVGGFRFDRATVPQSIYLSDVDRKGFTLFFDPLELSRRLR